MALLVYQKIYDGTVFLLHFSNPHFIVNSSKAYKAIYDVTIYDVANDVELL